MEKDLLGKKVIVGLSGGVDSSVCAGLLKKRGAEVIGLFMKNWEETDERGIAWPSKEFEDVVKVCESLDIPYYSVDFVEEYRENVFNDFLDGYKRGITPNPDILCNREIKFKVFYDQAMAMGADYLATGALLPSWEKWRNFCFGKRIRSEQRSILFSCGSGWLCSRKCSFSHRWIIKI